MKAKGELKEYRVIGRKLPTEKEPNPGLYSMKIFATDKPTAKSRYWYFIRQLKKMKKMSGEIISIVQVHSKAPTRVKNYGVWLRYNSRSGTHNMYKEYRDLRSSAAVTQCYREMGARHRARASSIQIIKIEELTAKQCKRVHVTQFHDAHLKFPLPSRVTRAENAPLFTTRRPHTCF